jgi:hypothetical protein
MNSTEVMNVDGVSPSDQQALAKVLNVDGDSLGADAKATASEVVGDGHVIGGVTFGQPSAWSSSLSESQPYAWLSSLRGSVTTVAFSLRGTHVAWKQERAPERDRVRNVMPEQHLSEDLAIMNPVDPQQQQANDTNTDCQAWTHSWQAPLSNAGITPSDKPQEQSSVDVAVVTTKAVFSLSGGFTGHMITQANSVGGVFNARTEVMTVSQDLVDLNAVDPQQQQAGCVSWIYSWQAPLSNTCVTTPDALLDQPAVDVAMDTTKAASGLSASLSKHMITQANNVGYVFNAMLLGGSKTDRSKRGCRRMQEASGDPILCPVKCMVEWFALTEGPAIPSSAPLFSVPKGREGLELDVLTRDVVTLLVKGAAADCGLDTALVGTHRLRISGATALLLAGVAPEVVQIIGRWASNAFIGYTRYQAELMKGVATRMVTTHYVVRPKGG